MIQDFDDWSDAYAACREAAWPLDVRVPCPSGKKHDVARIFPSGAYHFIRYEPTETAPEAAAAPSAFERHEKLAAQVREAVSRVVRELEIGDQGLDIEAAHNALSGRPDRAGARALEEVFIDGLVLAVGQVLTRDEFPEDSETEEAMRRWREEENES